MQYGPELWARISRIQLSLDNPGEFWTCLESGKPVPRPEPEQTAPTAPTKPLRAVMALIHGAGLSKDEVMQMPLDEVVKRYEEFLATGR